MQAIKIDSQKDRCLISIQKDMFDSDELIRILKWLRGESLAQKANIGDEILEVEKQINQDWWKKNEHLFAAKK
ncbi:MAG: hypothetical protein EAZ14_10390 [Runella slithyformis]|nr:MAG: hypothetical protein EAZ46_08145 [Runella sp.]TAG23792.1 MAG: hypothetical protein EAZ38_02615 [Cytophagales bacterium]TAG37986.1 MAG: hypothetical protein EAZ32_13705 [Cytophagia bacterium]TAG76547.1 MAG: hypothetical protein EAZ22_17795 [Cytophagales bacterium]TAH08113.1 MAG: hypothetical protein EAZ14_10390 [Runella slithyformis]